MVLGEIMGEIRIEIDKRNPFSSCHARTPDAIDLLRWLELTSRSERSGVTVEL